MTTADPALMSAETLLSLYARRALSPVEVLQAVTERVARMNPWVNAFAALNPRALQAAGESEARWAVGRPIGPLDGVPVTVKDVLNVVGFPTRRGSKTTDASPAQDDAPSVMGLKAAGAVVLGKTTTTEFGWKVPGDSPLHGITRNPWNRERTTGGSSSGAAAAAAACLGPLHLGTDTNGSLRVPAAYCGLVGLKPSFGRVAQWPHGPFASMSCAGPLTRTVGDAALMLSAMARGDVRDPQALPDDPREWRRGIEDGVAGLRVAVVRRLGFEPPLYAAGEAALQQAIGLLRDQGALVEEVDPQLPDLRPVFTRLWGVAIARMVERMPPNRRVLIDPGLEEVAAQERGFSGMDLLGVEALRNHAGHVMGRFHLRYDLVLTPTTPTAALPAEGQGTPPAEALWTEWCPWTAPFNLTRQPAIAVPMGLDEAGLPRSVQLVAALYREDLVLRAARALERAAPVLFPGH